MIDIRNFHSNLFKMDKKSHKDIDIYYIDYITITKYSDCENIHSVNPFCLIIYSAAEYCKAKMGEKYLIIDSTEKYGEVWCGIILKLKHLMAERICFMKKIMLGLELTQTMICL